MTETPDQTFARRLREERNRAGISQAELGGRLTTMIGRTIDPSAIARAEKCVRAVRLDEAVAIADLLGVPLTAMLRDCREAETRILQLRQDLRQAQEHANDAQDELRQALARVTSIQLELAEAEAARLP